VPICRSPWSGHRKAYAQTHGSTSAFAQHPNRATSSLFVQAGLPQWAFSTCLCAHLLACAGTSAPQTRQWS